MPLQWRLLWLLLADLVLSSQEENPYFNCIVDGLKYSKRVMVSGTVLPNAQW